MAQIHIIKDRLWPSSLFLFFQYGHCEIICLEEKTEYTIILLDDRAVPGNTLILC